MTKELNTVIAPFPVFAGLNAACCRILRNPKEENLQHLADALIVFNESMTLAADINEMEDEPMEDEPGENVTTWRAVFNQKPAGGQPDVAQGGSTRSRGKSCGRVQPETVHVVQGVRWRAVFRLCRDDA
jgi:hypothetical protein